MIDKAKLDDFLATPTLDCPTAGCPGELEMEWPRARGSTLHRFRCHLCHLLCGYEGSVHRPSTVRGLVIQECPCQLP